MHIPMAPLEIASFLDISDWRVAELSETGQLSRTIGCLYRPNPALNWSSIYDVLEYSFWTGRMSQKLSREHAALWIFVLSEADEEEGFGSKTHAEQVLTLVEIAGYEGFTPRGQNALDIAHEILATRAELLTYCEKEDRKFA